MSLSTFHLNLTLLVDVNKLLVESSLKLVSFLALILV